MFRSLDGGVTWTNVLRGVGLVLAFDPNVPGRFYATLDYTGHCSTNSLRPNGFSTSNDFGATWQCDGHECDPITTTGTRYKQQRGGRNPWRGTVSNSGPHADSRDMEIRADGYLLEGDDGGITVRSNPASNLGDWFGVCGNMQAFETHSVAYEPLMRTVLFGNQDTGTIAGTLPDTFTSLRGGDGND